MALFCSLLSFHARPARQRGGSKRQTPAKPVLPKVSLQSSGSGSVCLCVFVCVRVCMCMRIVFS